MKKVIVIGGGLSGLSAAVTLINNNINVVLLEASPTIGGRARAFKLPSKNIYLDNGQHLLLSCYKETLRFLDVISPDRNYSISSGLLLPFIFKGNRKVNLNIPSRYYPFNLLNGLINFELLSFRSKLKLLTKLFTIILRKPSEKTTVDDWLKNQDNDAIKYFWEMLGIGALNSSFDNAGAIYFRNILMEMFVRNKGGYRFIVPPKNLKEFYCDNVQNYVQKKGSKINVSEKVTSITINNNRIKTIITSKNKYSDFDAVVIAIPPDGLKKIFPLRLISNLVDNYSPSPIVSAHVFLRNNILNEPFVYLVNSKFDWIFNHNQFITLVKSNAEKLVKKEIEELKEMIKKELISFFPEVKMNDFELIKIIKEKKATFKSTPAFSLSVKNFKPNLINAEFAGDWSIPDLPATVESAVKSGKLAAENILKNL